MIDVQQLTDEACCIVVGRTSHEASNATSRPDFYATRWVKTMALLRFWKPRVLPTTRLLLERRHYDAPIARIGFARCGCKASRDRRGYLDDRRGWCDAARADFLAPDLTAAT